MDSRPKLETLTSLLFYFGQTDIVYIRKGSRIQEPGWIDLRHAIPQMFQNTLLVQRRGKLVQNGSSFSMLYRPPQLTCPAKDKLHSDVWLKQRCPTECLASRACNIHGAARHS